MWQPHSSGARTNCHTVIMAPDNVLQKEALMQPATFVRNLALAGVIAVGAIAIQGLHAEEKAKTTALLKTALSGVEGKEVNLKHMKKPAGWVSPKHYHPGHVFVYILEGTMVVEVEGQETRTVGPGEVFHELPKRVMQAKNASATDWVKFVIFQVGDEGTSLTVKVK